ncbi:NADAR family protein [Candidatus Saccharibacteria bacterium]|nr:NADAR family protein [Candidatus Saccharibacteria bacterium]
MYPDDYLNMDDDRAVYWFSSPFDPLNNWSAHALNVYGKVFHTLEHAYHYQKFVDDNPDIADEVANSPSPWAAMRVARKHAEKVRSDWHDAKVAAMESLLREKLRQNEDVAMILKKTGSRDIVENSPWDDFWGVGPNGGGQNMMGKLWVKIRDGK